MSIAVYLRPEITVWGKVIYLAGPMTGIPHFNFPRFNAVTAILRQYGNTVFNPAERDIERHGGVDLSKTNLTGSQAQAAAEHGFSLADALTDDLSFIMHKATDVVFLPGWEFSSGANLEWDTAKMFKRGFLYLTERECQMIEQMEKIDVV
jgi:hypothetical protein